MVAACEAIVPAVVNLESDLATVQTPEDYVTVMTGLRTTIESAAAQTTDTTFVPARADVSGDFQQAGGRRLGLREDPSTLEGALAAYGTQIDNDCAAAGYVQ